MFINYSFVLMLWFYGSYATLLKYFVFLMCTLPFLMCSVVNRADNSFHCKKWQTDFTFFPRQIQTNVSTIKGYTKTCWKILFFFSYFNKAKICILLLKLVIILERKVNIIYVYTYLFLIIILFIKNIWILKDGHRYSISKNK